MRKLTSLALLAGFLLVGACKGKDLTEDVEKLAERACACKDAACARAVMNELVKLSEDEPNASGDQERGRAAGQKLAMCAIKAGVEPNEVMQLGEKLQKK
jgi:hypothetical protein